MRFHPRLWRVPVPALIALSAALSIPLGHAPAAVAAWSVSGAGSSAGAATTMPAGSAPTGSALVTRVTISWSPATMANGTSVAGYVINRYDAATGTRATVGAGCSGVISTTTCTESSVPAGIWVYTDTPVQLSWTGGESADSAPITVG